MKNYIYTKIEAKNGRSYTLTVWENCGRNKPMKIVGYSDTITYGQQSGEQSEAWHVVVKNRPTIKRLFKSNGARFDANYWTCGHTGEYGIILQGV